MWPKLDWTPSTRVASRSCWWQQKLCPFSNPKDRTGVQVMVLLRIQADADLPLAQVQPGMDFMTDLDRQLPECVPFPNSPSINAQNIWCAHWTVVRSNRSTSGISRFVSYLWIQLAVLNFQNRSQQGTGSKFHQLEFKSIRFRTDGLDFTEIVTRQPLKVSARHLRSILAKM